MEHCGSGTPQPAKNRRMKLKETQLPLDVGNFLLRNKVLFYLLTVSAFFISHAHEYVCLVKTGNCANLLLKYV